MSFDDWWAALQNIAKDADLEWLLGDQEANVDAYQNDLTPRETMEELCEDALRS